MSAFPEGGEVALNACHVGSALALPTLETESVIVKGSAAVKDQLGVFTKRPFHKGETIFSVRGPVLRAATRYSFSLDVDRHIDPVREDGHFDFGHYLNHSCDPNTFIRIVDERASTYIDIVARRAITRHEELNFDYASLEYETIAQVTCECGTPLCRGTIHGFRELPDVVRDSYEHEGMIPAYLLELRRRWSAEPLRPGGTRSSDRGAARLPAAGAGGTVKGCHRSH